MSVVFLLFVWIGNIETEFYIFKEFASCEARREHLIASAKDSSTQISRCISYGVE